jgi:hypothetical protein
MSKVAFKIKVINIDVVRFNVVFDVAFWRHPVPLV